MNAMDTIELGTAKDLSTPPETRSWYAVQAWPRHEKKIDAELKRKGVESFLPLCTEKRQWSDRQQLVDVPLFPGYVFVRIEAEASTRVPVLRTSGVTGFVGARGLGTPIPNEQIVAVQSVVEQNIGCRSMEHLEVGQRVRIRGGILDGVQGVLVAVRGERKLVISVELIQRSLSISIEGYDVEPV